MIKEKISTFILGLLFLSLYFTGPKYEIDIGIRIIPIDIVTLFLAYAFLIYLLKGNKTPYIKNFSLVLAPLLLFIVIVGVDILRVDWPERNITLFIALLRDCLILIIVASLVFFLKGFQVKILKVITDIAVFVSLFSIGMYCFYFLRLPEIQANSLLWKSNIWYNLREAGVLSLSGPGRDPNFFGATALTGFVFSLFLFNRGKWYKLVPIVIFLSLILTFSRAIFVILLALLLILWLFSLFLSKNNILKKVRNNYSKMFALFMLLFLIFGIFYPQFKILTIFQERFVSGIEKRGFLRFDLWQKAVQEFKESPIFGGGGRAILMKEGNYVHNDYLEILSSYGIIGVIIMVFFLLLNLIYPLKCLSSPVVLGAYIILLCYIIFMVGFSIFFNAYLYFILGLLWGGIILEKQRRIKYAKRIST